MKTLKCILVFYYVSILSISCEKKEVEVIEDSDEYVTVSKTQENTSEKERDAIEEQKHREQQKRFEEELARLEQEKEEKIIYDKYINNVLSTGSTPYKQYYGSNKSCTNYGCSEIKVTTSNSDVIVTIKQNDRVVRHAYIRANGSYTFSFPNGTYQTFFYYGKGWNPEKDMKNGEMKGGFVANESFAKDDPYDFNNNILEYELILQQNGNFSTQSSNPNEAL